MGHNATMGAKGVVTIPSQLLKEMGFKDGDWLVLEKLDNGISIRARNETERGKLMTAR